MKKARRIISVFLMILLVIVLALVVVFKSKFPPDIKAEDVKIELTPERIQRGSYLANHVSMCIECHSVRDWNYFSGPINEDSFGTDGEAFSKEAVGVPGVIFAKNITPGGIAHYSDGELLRVITTGIQKDGNVLFPLMPYNHYGKMSREDIYSIIAYIRTLKPLNKTIPERHLEFPMNIIVNTIPVPARLTDAVPSKGDTLAYGEYMTNAAGCIECHTQREKGELLKGLEFAGGAKFQVPCGDEIYSANITPDMETGIGPMAKDAFIAKFKSFSKARIPVKAHEKNSVMPWTRYAEMTEEDLGAIYTYLRTVPPVSNKVVTFRPKTVL